MSKFFEKIKKFFEKLIKKEKIMLIEEKKEETTESLLIEKNEFKNKLDIRKEQRVIELQNKYERGEIVEEQLNPIQLIQLVKLYEKQVKDLDTTIKMQELMLNKS